MAFTVRFGSVQWIGRLTTRGLWRGAQIEFQSPTPLRTVIASFGDGDGSAIGDATASGDFLAFGDFAGAATGDATSSGEGTSQYGYPLSATYHLLTNDGFRRRQRTIYEVQTPLPLTVPVASGDADGAASGDAIASGSLDALADFAGSATGDATASGEFVADFDGAATGDATASAEGEGAFYGITFHRPMEWAAKDWLGRAPWIEFQVPLPIRAPVSAIQDGDGAVVGDATADGTLDAFGDFAGAATGDSTTSGDFTAIADFAGSATGDATVSGEITGRYDFPLPSVWQLLTSQGTWRKQREILEYRRPTPIAILNDQFTAGAATGDATASGDLAALGDFAGAASGDAAASGDFTALGDFAGAAIGDATADAASESGDTAGAATGDATASGTLDALADFAGSAIGDAIVSGEGDFSAPVVVAPTVTTATGVGGPAWRNWYRSTLPKKKKKKLDELDEMIAALEERIPSVPPEIAGFDEAAYERTLRVSRALAESANPDFSDITRQIGRLKRAVEDIDDEESIILAAMY